MLHLLKEQFNLICDVQWAYSATSHGKGIVDGIGGRAKALVRQAVMSTKNNVIVQCAEDFAEVAQQKKEEVLLVEDETLNTSPSIWEDVQNVPGIRKVHLIHLKAGVIFAMKNNLEREDPICTVTYGNNIDEQLYKTGDWVAVVYEGKEYRGIVTNVAGEGTAREVEVSVMHPILGGCFKWPAKEDKVYYPFDKVLCKTVPPVPAGSRGQFQFVDFM